MSFNLPQLVWKDGWVPWNIAPAWLQNAVLKGLVELRKDDHFDQSHWWIRCTPADLLETGELYLAWDAMRILGRQSTMREVAKHLENSELVIRASGPVTISMNPDDDNVVIVKATIQAPTSFITVNVDIDDLSPTKKEGGG